MEKYPGSTEINNCIECGKCTNSCIFLKKYAINLREYAQRQDLAYNCFLCGQCNRACPVNIDGKAISLDLRKKLIFEGYSPYKNGYGFILFEKKNYLFQNYKHVKGKTIFFPGCNLTGYYPKTTAFLSGIFSENGIGTIFDCCGKPVSELGLTQNEILITERMNKNIEKLAIEKVIFACPNCYYYLKDKIHAKALTIYHTLETLNMAKFEDITDGKFHLPCPDRDTEEIFNGFGKFINVGERTSAQCCGAGGCAFIKEPGLAQSLSNDFLGESRIYTYCATCCGAIEKAGGSSAHILCSLLGITEKPSFFSLMNRAISKLK